MELDEHREMMKRPDSEVAAVREEAIRRADMPPSEEWKEAAARQIENVAKQLYEFTSEEVWDYAGGLPEPAEGTSPGSALGPALRRAAALGIITPTGRKSELTKRSQRHSNPKRVWKSAIYKGSFCAAYEQWATWRGYS